MKWMLGMGSSIRFSPDAGADGGEEIVVQDGVGQENEQFGADDDLDIVLVDPDAPVETAPEPEKQAATASLDPSVLEAITAQSKSISDGLAALGSNLKAPTVAPANQIVQGPKETDEEFWARIEETAYKPGQFKQAFAEASGRLFGPVLGSVQNELLGAKKKLLATDPELGAMYKRFKDDVEARVQATPKNQWHGDIYEQKLKEIIAEKQPQLQSESIAEQVRKGIEEGLKAAGIDPATKKPAAVQALGSASVPATPKPKTKTLSITSRDINDMITRGIISEPGDVRNKQSPYYHNAVNYLENRRGR